MSVTTIPPAATNRIIGRHWNAGTQNQVSMPTSVRTRCAGGAKYGNGRGSDSDRSARLAATPTSSGRWAGSRLVTAIFRPASAGSPVAGCCHLAAPELSADSSDMAPPVLPADRIGVPQAAVGCTVPKMPIARLTDKAQEILLLLIDTTSCPRTHRSILIDGCSSIRRPERFRFACAAFLVVRPNGRCACGALAFVVDLSGCHVRSFRCCLAGGSPLLILSVALLVVRGLPWSSFWAMPLTSSPRHDSGRLVPVTFLAVRLVEGSLPVAGSPDACVRGIYRDDMHSMLV